MGQETIPSRAHRAQPEPLPEPTRVHRPVQQAEPTRVHVPPAVPQPVAEIVAPAPAPAKKRRRPAVVINWGLVAGVFTGLSALVLTAFVSWFGLYRLNDRIMPRVTVGEIALGGMTMEEAEAALAAQWQLEGAITLRDEDRRWQADPTDLGLALDAEATAYRAFTYGHHTTLLGGLMDFGRSLFGGHHVEPVIAVDSETARLGLEAWADTIVDTEPQNATIRIERGEVVGVPGVDGRSLDVEATLAALEAAPGPALLDGSLGLVVAAVPPAIPDAAPFVAQAEALLSAPVTLSAYDPIRDETLTHDVPTDEVAAWLTVAESDDGPAIGVEAARMTPAVEALGAQLDAERSLGEVPDADAVLAALEGDRRVRLPIEYGPTTYTVVAGDTLIRVSWKVGMPYWRILEANPGIDQNGLDVGDTLSIPPRTDLLPLPAVEGKRVVVDISDQRMWLYEDGEMYREYIISTGIDRSPTQPGVFQMTLFEETAYAGNWDLWMPDFIGIYEAWPGFMNGFHGLPTLSSGVTLWADILGSPASYGCIILDLDDSAELWEWAEPGIVVEIRE